MACGLQHLLRLPRLADELAAKGRQAAQLQDALLFALLSEHGLEGAAAQQQLLDLLSKLQLTPQQAEALASRVLARGGQTESDSPSATCLQHALRCAPAMALLLLDSGALMLQPQNDLAGVGGLLCACAMWRLDLAMRCICVLGF